MLTIEETAAAWVARAHARGLDEDERATLRAWLAADPRHHGAYARARAIENAISLATAPAAMAAAPRTGAMPDQHRDDHHDHLGDAGAGTVGGRGAQRRQWLRYGMAASVAAALVPLGWHAWQQEAVLTTAKGEFRKVPLRDQSIAEINSGSRIDVNFTQRQRRVTLHHGEAWFEVAKDQSKPFIVESGDARIRAVGTAFSVRRYASGTEVLVTEGTVQVWTGTAGRDGEDGPYGQADQGGAGGNAGNVGNVGNGGARLLSAGERAFLPRRAGAIAIARQPGEVQRKLAWREGKLILTNQTLGEAVADFNRYSPRAIVIADEGLAGKRLVGQYQLDAPELFASDVSTVLGVPLSITADTIYIGRAAGRTPRKR